MASVKPLNPVYLLTALEKEKIQFGAPGEATDCSFLRYDWWLWIPKRKGVLASAKSTTAHHSACTTLAADFPHVVFFLYLLRKYFWL